MSFFFLFSVVFQLGEDTFNRAKLLNVGYTEALKDAEYDCFIFSDVDLIPMDDRNLYHCYDQPRHFAIAMDKFGFRYQLVRAYYCMQTAGVQTAVCTAKLFEACMKFVTE